MKAGLRKQKWLRGIKARCLFNKGGLSAQEHNFWKRQDPEGYSKEWGLNQEPAKE